MKLRKKLAAALAATMVVSAVPVVTMADSSNKIQRASEVVKKDAKTTSAAVKIQFDDYEGREEFYLTLTNAEWLSYDDEDGALIEGNQTAGDVTSVTKVSEDEWKYVLKNGTKATYSRQDDKVMRVQFEVGSASVDVTNAYTAFPLPVKLTGGTASVALTGEGSNTTITEKSFTFASTGEKGATVAVDGDLETFFDAGELSKIVLKETYVGSLASENGRVLLKVSLNDTDFTFKDNATVKVKGTYGFNFNRTANLFVVNDDESTAYIEITGIQKGNSLGRIEITGLEVENDEKDIQTGKLLADIESITDNITIKTTRYGNVSLAKGAELDKDYDSVAVAEIVKYGASIKMKDDKAVDIVAGRDEEVTFTVGGRTMTLTLDSDEYEDSFFWIDYKANAADYKKLISDNVNGVVDKVEIEWNEDEKEFMPGGKNYDRNRTAFKADAIKVTLAKQDTKTNQPLNINKEKDKFEVKTKIYVPIDQKAKGSLSLVASMRGVNDFQSANAVNVINPFEVKFDQTTLKVGLQNQKAGKIAITETDKAMFSKGNIVLNVTSQKVEKGITVEEKGELKVEGELKKADLEDVKGTKQTIKLNRQSKAASTLTIEDMLLTVDRTVPEGTYSLELSGSAIDVHGGTLEIKDYIVIGTANTQDLIASNGLAKGTASFSMDKGTYTLNGVEKTMDAQVYIQDPGYTMVPVRYVAEAFGVGANDIMFGAGTVTIFAGTRTVQLTNNSSVAVVNGAKVQMSTAVVIKDGRTYAPIGEIAKILGISSEWDNTTKTATFENK